MLARLPIAFLLVISAVAAHAADVPLPGKRLALRQTRGRLAFVVRADLPVPGRYAPDSPIIAGARLEMTSGNGETAVLTLPAWGWKVNAAGTIFRFQNLSASTNGGG